MEDQMARTTTELWGLEFEAERLVRSGESRAEVSRRLGVHPTTLSQWALRGGWRRKDIELELQRETSRETIRAIRDGNKQVEAQNTARAQLRDFMKDAVRLLAAGDEASMEELSRRLGGVEAPKRLEAVTVAPADDPKCAPFSLGKRDPDAPEEPVYLDDGREWSPALQREINRAAWGSDRPSRRSAGMAPGREDAD
jgi:transposase-like protein